MAISMRLGLAVLALSLWGCQPEESLRCGAGTLQIGDQCVADPGIGMMMPPPAGTDAGTSTPPPPPPPPPPPGDAGPGWGTTPPGAPPLEPGCDVAAGECAAWATELAALIEAHAGRGCASPVSRPAGIQGVADRHAAYQASVDMLDASSPDGDLFTQIRASGETFMFAGALFSVGRLGAADVMGRWVEGADTAAVLDQCWTMAGVSFATGASGWSYATVLLAR